MPGYLRSAKSRLANRLAPSLAIADIFPAIDEELGPYKHLFIGNVLNAGSGGRDISGVVEGHLYNQDIAVGLRGASPDFVAPLHEIPTADGFFDTIICNAVLEHVANPDEVMDEFARVSAPGATLYVTIPFMQPEHRDPTDYQRYTIDGIVLLCERHGFAVKDVHGVHSVYTTLAWIFHEWLGPVRGWRGIFVRAIAYRWVMSRIRSGNRRFTPSLASAHRVIAKRRGDA